MILERHNLIFNFTHFGSNITFVL